MLTNSLRLYYSEFGSSPDSGSSPGSFHLAIMAALRGNNPKHIVFDDFDSSSISPAGVYLYLDPWGTPYYFDTTDPANPKVRSFGPNRKDDHGTPDSDDILDTK